MRTKYLQKPRRKKVEVSVIFHVFEQSVNFFEKKYVMSHVSPQMISLKNNSWLPGWDEFTAAWRNKWWNGNFETDDLFDDLKLIMKRMKLIMFHNFMKFACDWNWSLMKPHPFQTKRTHDKIVMLRPNKTLKNDKITAFLYSIYGCSK